MSKVWYVLEDGSAVDPADVTTGENGRLIHKRGAVAMRGDVPTSRGIYSAADIRLPDEKPTGTYKTRESKAR